MKCPFCSSDDNHVKDSRAAEDNTAIRRRRFCNNCGARYNTFERVQLRDIYVVKRNGERVDFDREKLAQSIRIATRKRPIPAETLQRTISGVIRELEELNQDEIETVKIGETIMSSLARLDPVAHIRFASVYKDFQDATDFGEFLAELSEPNDD